MRIQCRIEKSAIGMGIEAAAAEGRKKRLRFEGGGRPNVLEYSLQKGISTPL